MRERLAFLVPALCLLAACAKDEGDGLGVDLPRGEHCDPVADWDASWVELEEDVLVLVNEHRAQGATCGGESFGPTGPLSMQGNLVCAARLHSLDMAENGYFDHTNQEGQSPWDRMEEAGYAWSAAAENIARGQQDAAQVMDSWMNSPGHCANIMNPDLEEIGVGYVLLDGGAPHWTQVFGTPQ
jgi:uncharacterized protein YkwD